MWEIVRQVSDGQFETLGTCESLEEWRTQKASHHDAFIFPTGLSDYSHEELHGVVANALAANEGRVLRLVIGAEITPVKVSNTSCGSCFCVTYTNGVHQCEGQYCNENGYCWWVVCSAGC